jgi:hypothetical protein
MNMIDKFDDTTLAEIAERIIRETEDDLQDRQEWDDKVEIWTKLWNVQPTDRDNAPWEDASNVCVPLVTSACEQAHERGYSAYFDGGVGGFIRAMPVEDGDIPRAARVEKVMEWQFTTQIREWETEHDRLMTDLPKTGVAWKKVWQCKKEERPKTMFVSGPDVIVPYDTRPFHAHEARRLTHRYRLHPSVIAEHIEEGYFAPPPTPSEDEELEYGARPVSLIGSAPAQDSLDQSPAHAESDSIEGFEPVAPESQLCVILERHERVRVDGEWHAVIVWVLENENRVLRVESREHEGKVIDQFVDYHFILSPFGFYSYGYGHFLGPLNFIANTVFNQYIDAARISNQPFMFYTPGAGFRKKSIRLRPGEGVQVRDIAQVKIEKMAGLDGSLAQLLTMIDHYGSDISNNTEEARGRTQRGVREPTVRGQMGRLEQALMGFGVKVRRMMRSTQREAEIIFNLNSLHLPNETAWRVTGEHGQPVFGKAIKADFDKRLDIVPRMSPGFSTRAQTRAEMLEALEVATKLPNVGLPRADGQVANKPLLDEMVRRFLQTFSMGELARFVPEPPAPPLPPGVEHQRWLEGEVPDPTEGEDHFEHIAEHRLFLASGPAIPAEVAAEVAAHIERTYMMALAAQGAQMPPVQQAPQGQPGIAGDGSDFAGEPGMGEMA